MRGNRLGGPRGIQRWIAGILFFFCATVSPGLAQGSAKVGSAAAQPSATPAGPKPEDNLPSTVQIRVQSNLVTAPVTVTDRATGEYVYDLKRSDFAIYDNDMRQKIQLFDREAHKIAVVVVIQNSDVLAPLLNQIKSLAPLFSQLMLGEKGEAAVISYDGRVREEQGFSSSPEVLNKTFRHLTADGSGSRLNDALMQAMNLLEKRPKLERRVIVVFSTGYDAGSSTTKEQVIRRATHAEVEIYGLGMSLTRATLTRKRQPQVAQNPLDANVTGPSIPGRPSTPSSMQESFGEPADMTQDLVTAERLAKSKIIRNDMENYSRYTGGVFYKQWTSGALQVNLGQIASELHSQYELAYVPDNLTKGFHRIEIRVDRPDVKVRTRLGYFFEGSP